ncbi:MAG: hypothetical protein HY225_00645 [Candidatus Vogelbacteria bacterium]|nr:hypothetical protein [Candidatus Vogelbacteria bacterium]
MEDKFKITKGKIKDCLSSYANNTGGFTSISIVGSHAEDEKLMEKVNDVDIVFIFSELNPERYRALTDFIEKFCVSETVPGFGVIMETRFGPFKTASDQEITFQLHCLIFDVKGFEDYTKKSPLVVFDWQRFSPLYGKRIEKISLMPGITSKAIITARGGIDYSLEQIREGVNIAIRVQFTPKGKLERVIEKFLQTIEQKAETCYKSPYNILLNMWKLNRGVNQKPDDEELFDYSMGILGEDVKSKFLELKHTYKDARAGIDIKEVELARCQEISLNLLERMKLTLI